MRTVILPQALSPRVDNSSELSVRLGSGPGSPIFQPGPQTRIYRAPVKAIGAATCGGREVWGQILDISLGGCLLKTEDPLELGSEVDLRITIIGEGRRAVADVQGIVRRLTEDGGSPAYGIELVARDSDARRVLQWLYGQAMR